MRDFVWLFLFSKKAKCVKRARISKSCNKKAKLATLHKNSHSVTRDEKQSHSLWEAKKKNVRRQKHSEACSRKSKRKLVRDYHATIKRITKTKSKCAITDKAWSDVLMKNDVKLFCRGRDEPEICSRQKWSFFLVPAENELILDSFEIVLPELLVEFVVSGSFLEICRNYLFQATDFHWSWLFKKS